MSDQTQEVRRQPGNDRCLRCGDSPATPTPATSAPALGNHRLTRRSVLGRALAIGITIALPSTILAACGGDDDDEPAATPTTGTSATPTTAAAAATPSAAEPESGRGGSIVVARTYDGDSLDPHRTARTDEFFRNLYDPLVARNPQFEFEGVVSESWEVSEDGLEYRFKIRDGMTFHDGSPVTAQDVKYTWDRASNPADPSLVMGFLEPFDSAELVDPSTVALLLKTPVASFLAGLTTTFWGVLPEKIVEERGTTFGIDPVGSGPWKFQEWILNEQLTLVPYADYVQTRTYVENPGGPLADELVFRTIPEEATQVAAFQTGEVNVMTLPSHEVENFQGDAEYQVFAHPTSGCISMLQFASLPTTDGSFEVKAPLDDLRTRQAVAHALNVEQLIDSVFGGFYGRIYGPIATGWFAYDPAIKEFGYPYDPERAMALLDEAGWVDENDDGVREKDGEDLELLLRVANYAGQSESAQVFQNQLGLVGIKVNLEVLESGAAYDSLTENTHDLFIDQSCWNDPDVLNYLATISYGVGNYQREDYIALITEAQQINDQPTRKDLYFDASKMMLSDLPMIPLWSATTVDSASAEVVGMEFDMDNYPIWEDVYIKA